MRKIQEKVLNYYQNSEKEARVVIHVVFWVLMYLLEFLKVRSDMSFMYRTLVASLYFLLSITFFYTLAYWGFPRLLLKGRYLSFLLLLLVLYIWYGVLNYYSTWAMIHFQLLPTKYTLHSFKMDMLNKGLWGSTFDLSNLFFNFFEAFLPALLPLMIKLGKSFSELSNKTLKLERDNLVLELNYLRSQLNPHFLFNSLNNVYSLILKKDDKSASVILKLAGLMRYTLYEANAEKIALSKEVNFILDYLDLAKLRYGKKVRVEFETSGEIEGFMIPSLLLISFVENAFKHGVNDITLDIQSWVKISLDVQDGIMTFIISNNKPSQASNKLAINSNLGGIGIENTRKRLDLLYPDCHKLHIENARNTYTVNLSLKL